MKDATLAQGNQVLSLILQKKKTSDQLQELIASGLLSDLLSADISRINRHEFQFFLMMEPMVKIYNITTATAQAVEEAIGLAAYYNVPEDRPMPSHPLTCQEIELLLLDLGDEEFLRDEEDEDFTRNISDPEVLELIQRRGYEPCGIAELITLANKHPELTKKHFLSLCGFQKFLREGKEELFSVSWGPIANGGVFGGTLHIHEITNSNNYGSGCRFLARRKSEIPRLP